MKSLSLCLLAMAGYAVVVLPGCSTIGIGTSEFACPGMPRGFICKTPREVYEATGGDMLPGGPPSSVSPGKPSEPADLPFSRPVWKSESGPMPVLEHAQVLRIWIAPWVDSRQTLNWPSYVFTEITPRKWSFGGVEFHARKPLTPLVADFKSGRPAPQENDTAPIPSLSGPFTSEGSNLSKPNTNP